MMRPARMALAALLGLAMASPGCGPASDLEVIVTLESHLDSVDRVDLLVFGSEATCTALSEDTAASAASPACSQDATGSGCTLNRVEITDFESAPVLFVSAGRRSVLGLGYDGDGTEVASGCGGPVDIEAGETTRLQLRLQ